MADEVQKIHGAMLQVATAMNRSGIEKARESKAEGKYKYRGIDDVLNQLAQPMVDARLTNAPSYKLISQTNYRDKGLISIVEGSITFYAEDGSSRVCGPFLGEAFDGMDKGCSKAQSVAYRNGMLLTFVIPLGPGHDPEEGEEGEDLAQGAAQERTQATDALPGGIHLTGAQLKWLDKKMAKYGVDEAALLKQFRRVDAKNAPQVGEWLDAE